MSEQRAEYATIDKGCTIATQDYVEVSRTELEQEHTHLLGRIQQLRRLLGYPPLPTGKELRRQAKASR